MNKIFFLVFSFIIILTARGQDSVRDTLQPSNDSISVDYYADFSVVRQEENVTKAEGDSAYLRNDYALAIQVYENLLKRGEAAEIYYNLGNSYYKVGDIAKSILNYERALLLQPGNVDIRANLEIVRAKTVDRIVPVPEIFFVAWTKTLINMLGVDAWGKLGIVFFIFLLISCSLFFFSKQIVVKKVGFIAGWLWLVLVVLSNVFAAQQKCQLTQRDDAIVLTPSVTVRSTPSESGVGLFILHEGCKVKIKDNSMRDWKEIRLEDGKVGWLPAITIEGI